MEIHYPALPRIYCVGSFAAAPQPLSWLSEITQLQLESVNQALVNPARLADAHLVLIDADLPESAELCRRLKQTAACAHLPLLAMSRTESPASAARLLASGITDCIPASLPRELFLARIQTQVNLQTLLQLLRDRSEAPARRQRVQRQATAAARDATIHALAVLIESRSPALRSVNKRLERYIAVLADEARRVHSEAAVLTPDLVALLAAAAPLQQLGTFDAVATDMSAEYLHSPSGKCSQAIRCAQMLSDIEARHEQPTGLLQTVKDMLFFQQEHWDGSGMPMGLHEREIPMAARLLSLVNAYEEIVGSRVGLAPFLHEQACEHIDQLCATVLDPELVEAFRVVAPEFMQIAMAHAEPGQAVPAAPAPQDTDPTRSLFKDIAERTSRSRAGAAILQELDIRISGLSDQVALFVIALAANTRLLPRRLSDYMRAKLADRVNAELGPVHYSFTKIVNAHLGETSADKSRYRDDLTMLQACGGSAAAIQALHFIMNLATIPITAPGSNDPALPGRPLAGDSNLGRQPI